MVSLISQALIDRYSSGPSSAKVTKVANLQTTIRSVLGDDDYDTFLQGSYRNGTALAHINDVDIVARRKAKTSPLSGAEWERLFSDIATRLRNSYRITGSVSLGNKCVKLSTASLNADVVPAVAIGDFTTDPVGIWSRRSQSQSRNFPRTHYDNGVRKQTRTSDSFKPTVRLFKRWKHQYANHTETAPSFYVECAVHGVPDNLFSGYLPRSFVAVGQEISSWSRYKVIKSVAGDKDILVSGEWDPAKFEPFKERLARDVRIAASAMRASTAAEANRLWKHAFGES